MSGAPTSLAFSSYLKLICWTSEECLFWNPRLPKLQIWPHCLSDAQSLYRLCMFHLSFWEVSWKYGGGRDMRLFPSTWQKKITGKRDRGHTHDLIHGANGCAPVTWTVTYHLCSISKPGRVELTKEPDTSQKQLLSKWWGQVCMITNTYKNMSPRGKRNSQQTQYLWKAHFFLPANIHSSSSLGQPSLFLPAWWWWLYYQFQWWASPSLAKSEFVFL